MLHATAKNGALLQIMRTPNSFRATESGKELLQRFPQRKPYGVGGKGAIQSSAGVAGDDVSPLKAVFASALFTQIAR